LPIDLSKVTSRSRMVTIPELGELVFREPTLADAQRSALDPYWWVACVTCADGTPFLTNAQDAGRLRADVATAVLAEVNAVRPTAGSSDVSGASPTTKDG
jgi:hypothetical protein